MEWVHQELAVSISKETKKNGSKTQKKKRKEKNVYTLPFGKLKKNDDFLKFFFFKKCSKSNKKNTEPKKMYRKNVRV